MQLKGADDKQPDIDALEAILSRPDLHSRTRREVEDEIWNIRAGARAERDAAYEIEFHLGDSRNFVTIHDLRLEVDGHAAQIDHLVISRLLEIWVCESKSFSHGVKVNEHGEWTTFVSGRPKGIPSPVEQNRRHIAVLERTLKSGYVEPPRRVGLALKPRFVNTVLISKHGSIGRPRKSLPDLEAVMKVDQLRTRLLERDIPTRSMLKLIGQDTLESFGRQLVALHTPHTKDWAARFGVASAPPTAEASEPATPRRRGLRCASCGESISYAVAKFCWVNKPRFGGLIYCMPCQQRVAPAQASAR